VGVDRLVETLYGRDGRDHGMRIGGRKNEARGGIMRRGAVNAGHVRKGAHFAVYVCVKPLRDV
jgi:hypothetical protein